MVEYAMTIKQAIVAAQDPGNGLRRGGPLRSGGSVAAATSIVGSTRMSRPGRSASPTRSARSPPPPALCGSLGARQHLRQQDLARFWAPMPARAFPVRGTQLPAPRCRCPAAGRGPSRRPVHGHRQRPTLVCYALDANGVRKMTAGSVLTTSSRPARRVDRYRIGTGQRRKLLFITGTSLTSAIRRFR